MHGYVALALVSAGASAVAHAASVERVTVGHHGARYHIDLHMRLDVTAAQAWRVLTDFDELPQLNPVITHVKVWSVSGSEHIMVDAVVHGCVLFFCKDVKQLQNVVLHPAAQGGTIDSTLVPAHSDFSYGVERWRALPCATDIATTCVHFTATVQPKFWIPPWLGPMLVEHEMRKEAVVLARGVERRAQARRAKPSSSASTSS